MPYQGVKPGVALLLERVRKAEGVRWVLQSRSQLLSSAVSACGVSRSPS